jgi:hypothetical protein
MNFHSIPCFALLGFCFAQHAWAPAPLCALSSELLSFAPCFTWQDFYFSWNPVQRITDSCVFISYGFNFKIILIIYHLIDYKMKKAISCRSLILLIPSMMLFSGSYAQTIVPVRGTGPAVDKTINVSDFKGIDVSSGIDVILLQGNSESLTLTAQENLFEYITASVDNGTLKIYARNNIRPTQPMKARITFKNINNLKVSGGGDTYGETPLNVGALDVQISGGGDFSSVINSEVLNYSIGGGGDTEIGGKTKDYNISVAGGGDLESKVSAEKILCRIGGGGDLYLRNESMASNADIEINGGGDADLKISAAKLRCSIGGGGDALIAGQASESEIDVNGGGDVDAKNLSSEIILFNARGGSDLILNSTKEISGSISGGGDLYYYGNPSKVSVEARGGSEVHKQ